MIACGAGHFLSSALAVVSAFDLRIIWVVLALVVLAWLVRRSLRVRRDDRVLVVRVLAGGPSGQRIEITGGLRGRGESEIRVFVDELDLPPGAALWVIREGETQRVRGNHLVPEHMQERFRQFVEETN
jgi:hypothetical protein